MRRFSAQKIINDFRLYNTVASVNTSPYQLVRTLVKEDSFVKGCCGTEHHHRVLSSSPSSSSSQRLQSVCRRLLSTFLLQFIEEISSSTTYSSHTSKLRRIRAVIWLKATIINYLAAAAAFTMRRRLNASESAKSSPAKPEPTNWWGQMKRASPLKQKITADILRVIDGDLASWPNHSTMCRPDLRYVMYFSAAFNYCILQPSRSSV